MTSFGGAVKLTGESEYRAALRNITQNLKEVSSEMKLVASQYDKSDTSTQALTAKQNVLNEKLEQQKQRLSTLQAQYAKMSDEYAKNSQKHDKLVQSYEEEKAKLERIGQELGTSSAEYKAQAAVVAQLAKDVDKSAAAQDSNANAMSRMRVQMNNAQTEINKTKAEIRELDSQMEKASGSADDMGDSMSGAKGDAEGLGRAVQDAGEKAHGAGSGGFTVLKGALANLAGNVMQSAISGIQSLAGEAINSSDALKKFESTMSFAGYDDSTISKAKDDMKEYADKTVYDLDTVANTTAQLAANGIQDYTGLTQAAGNLNAVAGGNADTFKSVAMVLTQTAGAGKLTTENWNQLADAIPGASGKLQEALQKNGAYTGNFRDAMAQGQITADEFNQAIMDLGFTDAAKQAATSTSTFEGAMGNMQAAVTDGLMQIYDAIGSENVTGFINGISDAVSKVVPPIKQAIQWFKDNLPTIAPLLSAIAGALGGLMVAEKIMALSKAFGDWKAKTEGVTIAQKLLNAAMSANPIGIVLTLIGALVAGFVALYTTNEDFRNSVNAVWSAITDTIGGAIQSVVGFFSNLGTTISQLPQMFSDWLNSVIATVSGWVSNMASNAASAGSQFVQNVVNFVQQLPGKIGAFLTNVISRAGSWVSQMASKASSAGSQFLNNVVRFYSQLPGRVASFLSQVISRLASWAGQMAARGAAGARSMFNAVVNGLASLPGRVLSIGGDVVRGIWDGISGTAGWLADKVKGFASGILDGMKSALGIHSPSRLFRDQVGKYIAQGIGVGFESEMGNVTRQMQEAMPDSSAFSVGGTMTSAAYQSAGAGFGGHDGIVDAVVEALGRVHIVLDDEVAGKFVERTVTNAIYA